MPEYAMWTLIVSLIILSLTLTLKIVDLRQRLKVSENEQSRLTTELESFKDIHEKKISDIKELNAKEIEKINNSLSINSSQIVMQIDNKDIELLKIIATIENPLANHSEKINALTLISWVKKSINISSQDLKHRLEKLEDAHYIYVNDLGELYGLTSHGRSFLKEKNKLP